MAGRIRTTLSSLAQNWSMTQKVYKLLPLEVGGLFLARPARGVVPIGLLLNWFTAIILAIPAGLLAGTFWFSRRAMSAAYSQIDGQPGAAAAVIQSLRGGNWLVTPAVAVNKSQDIITRVVGKPGVVLVSEGPSSRVVPMLANERKRTARWLPEVPIYEIQVGNDEGQVPLPGCRRRSASCRATCAAARSPRSAAASTRSATRHRPCPSPRARCRRAPARCAARASR